MKIGICCEVKDAPEMAAYGFDYFESGVAKICCPLEGANAFAAVLRALQSAPLPCLRCNSFVPGEVPICGPQADPAQLTAFASTALARAAAAGVEVVVFGSGGARRIPEGFSAAEAQRQLFDFCRMTAEFAEKFGVTVVIEPLNSKETNVFTSVTESAAMVRKVNNPHLRLLVDSFHWLAEKGTDREILDNADLFAHVHIATWPERCAPGYEECGLEHFCALLKQAGYNGTVSFEGKIVDRAVDIPRMVKLMRQWTA